MEVIQQAQYKSKLRLRNASKKQSCKYIVLMYSPDGINVYGARGGEIEGIGSVYGVESCQILFLGGTSYSLVQTLLL